jgi:hypothetical protein
MSAEEQIEGALLILHAVLDDIMKWSHQCSSDAFKSLKKRSNLAAAAKMLDGVRPDDAEHIKQAILILHRWRAVHQERGAEH